jgi:hypothetical protein
MKRNYTVIKMKFLLCIFSCLVSFNTEVFAQAPTWIWAKAFGDASFENDIGTAIAVDASNYVYTTGHFAGTVDFDAGPAVFNLTAVGYNDIFVSKMDASGNFIWAISMGSPNFDYGQSIAIDLSGSGDILVTGSISDSVDFDPGPGVYNVVSSGFDDIFVARYDSSGNFIWVRSVGAWGSQEGRCIVVDPFGGNIYVSGNFAQTVDFDPGPAIFNLTSSGYDDGYILKLDPSGNLIWAKALNGTNDNYCPSIAIEPGSAHFYITGGFSSTVDFDPNSSVYNASSSGLIDIFISKLDSAGNLVWVKSMGSSDNDFGFSITVNESAVYVTGMFTNTVDFDPGIGVATLTSAGDNDIYVSKLDTAGNYLWTKRFGGPGFDRGGKVLLDPNGDVYTTGLFAGTVDFDPGSGAFMVTTPGNSADLYILKLNSSGDFVWVKSGGGPNSEAGACIAFDASGSLYLTGYFYSPSVAFGGTTLTNVQSIGVGVYSDFFIAKLDTSFITGNNEVANSLEKFFVYPNPFTHEISITTDMQNWITSDISIKNILGYEVMKNITFEQYPVKLKLENLHNGIYFVEINSGEKRIVKTIVKY